MQRAEGPSGSAAPAGGGPNLAPDVGGIKDSVRALQELSPPEPGGELEAPACGGQGGAGPASAPRGPDLPPAEKYANPLDDVYDVCTSLANRRRTTTIQAQDVVGAVARAMSVDQAQEALENWVSLDRPQPPHRRSKEGRSPPRPT